MGKKNIFSKNDYQKLKRANDKRLKYFEMEDRDLMKNLITELDIRGASRAYIEVVRTDLINAMIHEEKSHKSVKKDLKGILGGDVEAAIDEIMEAAPQRTDKQNLIMAIGDAFFSYIFVLGIAAAISGSGYRFVFGPALLAIVILSFVVLFLITRNTGRNAKSEEGRRRSGGQYKLIVAAITSASAALSHMVLKLPEPWYVNSWIPIIISLMCWLSLYDWDSKINDDKLTEIQKNYTD